MAGMAEVGGLFNNNELIVAEVLQSAEVMKASVAYLEQFMEKNETRLKVKLFWQRLKAMCMISAKTWSRSFFLIMVTRLLIWGLKYRLSSLLKHIRKEKAGCDRIIWPAGEICAADGHSPHRICALPELMCRFWLAAPR